MLPCPDCDWKLRDSRVSETKRRSKRLLVKMHHPPLSPHSGLWAERNDNAKLMISFKIIVKRPLFCLITIKSCHPMRCSIFYIWCAYPDKFQKILTSRRRRPDFGLQRRRFESLKRRFKNQKRRFCFACLKNQWKSTNCETTGKMAKIFDILAVMP